MSQEQPDTSKIIQEQLDQAARDVSQYKIPVILQGPMPSGAVWCACCAVLYVGAFSADPAFHKFINKRQAAAKAEGMDSCYIELAEGETTPMLQPAITVAPSVFSDTPMPVCWSHLKPYTYATPEQRKEMENHGQPQQSLIPGKRYWTGPGSE